MVSKKSEFSLFVAMALVLTVLLSIGLVSSGVVMVNPVNGTNGQNISKTNILFNVTLINATTGDLLNPINATFYASPNGNGTWLLIGNTTASSGCVFAAGNAAYNFSCSILLNITNSQITDGNYTINATVYNVSTAIGVNGTIGNINMSTSVTIDGTAPAVVANLTTLTGLNVSNATTGAYTINVSVIDSLINLGSVRINITNASSTQVALLVATNATAGATYKNRYFNATWNVTAFNDGLYNLTIYANDSLGNMNSSVRIQVVVDSVNPNFVAANITSVGTGHNITGTYVFNFSVSDLNSSIGSVMINVTNSTNSTIYFASLETGTKWVASVNTASYADGSYNVTVTVNDTAGNQNSSVSALDLRFDNSGPAVSLTCTPNPVEQGDTITCTCTSSDAYSGIRSTGAPSTTDTANSGPHTSTCSATNMVNITGTASYDYTVSGGAGGSSSSSSSSGSGSSSGGVGVGNSGEVKRTFDIISVGETRTISGIDASFGVKSLDLSVKEKVTGVKVTIDKFDNKPSGASVAKNGKVYKYLQITATNVEGKLNNAVITTLVTKKWVADNGLTMDKIALFRLVGNAWTELPTTIKESGDNYELASTTPGFSFFSIAEKTPAAAAADAASAAAADKSAASQQSTSSKSGLIWGVIIVLIVIVAIFFLVKKKVTSPRK